MDNGDINKLGHGAVLQESPCQQYSSVGGGVVLVTYGIVIQWH